jgi:hypothetical protein
MPPAAAGPGDHTPLPEEYATLRISGDEEDALQAAAALASVQQLRERLDAARAQGRRFRRRVQLPVLTAGALLLLLGILLRATAMLFVDNPNYGAVANFQAIMPAAVGIVVLIFFVDRRECRLVRSALCILAVNGVIFAAGALALPLTVARQITGWEDGEAVCVAQDGAEARPRTPCSFVFIMLVTTSIIVLSLIGWVASVVHGLCSPTMRPRDLLERATESTGRLFLVSGTCLLLPLLVAAGLGMVEQTLYWWTFGLCAAELLAFSALFFRRQGLHRRVQSWLASRSEATSTASGVASLLNERDVGAITALAKLNFRAAKACDVTLEALSTSAPDPALQALSRQCAFGECDAFVTHSWGDDPGAKWRALQLWRTQFAARRGREPLVWIGATLLPTRAPRATPSIFLYYALTLSLDC